MHKPAFFLLSVALTLSLFLVPLAISVPSHHEKIPGLEKISEPDKTSQKGKFLMFLELL